MRTLLLIALFTGWLAAQPSAPPRGWDQYQVLMWSTGSPVNRAKWIERLRELGFTGEECNGCDAAPDAHAGFGFYLENMVQELAFLHGRAALYQSDWDHYTKAPHDQRYLVRKPSLNDPDFWRRAKPSVQALVRQYAGLHPLLYQLRDELSIGSYASPMDYDFAPQALGQFRTWLRGVYGSLDALNREWQAGFRSWDEVQPLDTYEIKERAGENYAPWADHRHFVRLDRGIHFRNSIMLSVADGDFVRTADDYVEGDPIWLRLQRNGSRFTASYSSDGVRWLPLKRVAMTPYPEQEQDLRFEDGRSWVEMTAGGPFQAGLWGHGSSYHQNQLILAETITDFDYFQIQNPAPEEGSRATPRGSVQVTVPGTANPWLAGMPAGSRAGCYRIGTLCDSAPDQSPVRVPKITLHPGASLTFSASGKVSNGPVCCTAGPDGEPPHQPYSRGYEGSPVTVPAQNGIQGVSLPRNSLVGVFLGPERPDLSPAPEPGPAGSPALRQVFLIGSHTAVTVPQGALRLYLGTIDAYHWSDNSGEFSVAISSYGGTRTHRVDHGVGHMRGPSPGTANVPIAGMPFRDDFAGELKPGWRWIDPQGDSLKTLYAVHSGLRITVTGPHDLYWETGFEAPRLLREADGDFTLETKVSGPDAWSGGLLVWKDQQNYVRLDRGNHFLNEVSFQASDHGHYIRAAAEFLAGSPVWLRLQRRGPVFTASYSFDGREWRSLKRRLVRPVTMYPKIGAKEDEMSFVEGASSLQMTASGPFLVGIWGHGGAPEGTTGYLTQTVTDFGYFQIDVP